MFNQQRTLEGLTQEQLEFELVNAKQRLSHFQAGVYEYKTRLDNAKQMLEDIESKRTLLEQQRAEALVLARELYALVSDNLLITVNVPEVSYKVGRVSYNYLAAKEHLTKEIGELTKYGNQHYKDMKSSEIRVSQIETFMKSLDKGNPFK